MSGYIHSLHKFTIQAHNTLHNLQPTHSTLWMKSVKISCSSSYVYPRFPVRTSMNYVALNGLSHCVITHTVPPAVRQVEEQQWHSQVHTPDNTLWYIYQGWDNTMYPGWVLNVLYTGQLHLTACTVVLCYVPVHTSQWETLGAANSLQATL